MPGDSIRNADIANGTTDPSEDNGSQGEPTSTGDGGSWVDRMFKTIGDAAVDAAGSWIRRQGDAPKPAQQQPTQQTLGGGGATVGGIPVMYLLLGAGLIAVVVLLKD